MPLNLAALGTPPSVPSRAGETPRQDPGARPENAGSPPSPRSLPVSGAQSASPAAPAAGPDPAGAASRAQEPRRARCPRGERCGRARSCRRPGRGLPRMRGPERRGPATPAPGAPLGCAPGSGAPSRPPPAAPVPIHRPLLSQTFTRRGVPLEQVPRPPPSSRSPARPHRLSIAPPPRRDRTRGGKHPKKPLRPIDPPQLPRGPGPKDGTARGPEAGDREGDVGEHPPPPAEVARGRRGPARGAGLLLRQARRQRGGRAEPHRNFPATKKQPRLRRLLRLLLARHRLHPCAPPARSPAALTGRPRAGHPALRGRLSLLRRRRRRRQQPRASSHCSPLGRRQRGGGGLASSPRLGAPSGAGTLPPGPSAPAGGGCAERAGRRRRRRRQGPVDGNCLRTVPSGTGRDGTGQDARAGHCFRRGSLGISPRVGAGRHSGVLRAGKAGAGGAGLWGAQGGRDSAAVPEGAGRKGTGGQRRWKRQRGTRGASPKAEKVQVPGEGQGPPASGRDHGLPDRLSQDL